VVKKSIIIVVVLLIIVGGGLALEFLDNSYKASIETKEQFTKKFYNVLKKHIQDDNEPIRQDCLRLIHPPCPRLAVIDLSKLTLENIKEAQREFLKLYGWESGKFSIWFSCFNCERELLQDTCFMKWVMGDVSDYEEFFKKSLGHLCFFNTEADDVINEPVILKNNTHKRYFYGRLHLGVEKED